MTEHAEENPKVFLFFILLIGCVVAFLNHYKAEQKEEQIGFIADPESTKRFLEELNQPYFSDAGKDIVKNATNKDTFLYRNAETCHLQVYGKGFAPFKQGIGDCVSMGWALGSWIGTCVDYTEGELPEPPKVVATEPIYGGARVEQKGIKSGGYRDGATGSGAARWVMGLKNGTGGILYREPYKDIDLTIYSPERAKAWGNYGCGGEDNVWLDKKANEHTARDVALVRTYDEATAAIQAGMPVVICSNIGFKSPRGPDGFCKRGPSWSHCMCATAVRFKENAGGRDGVLIQNSWGNYLSGPKWPQDQPNGSFWCDEKTFQQILAQGESFAIAGVNGFQWRNLDHGDWLEVER